MRRWRQQPAVRRRIFRQTRWLWPLGRRPFPGGQRVSESLRIAVLCFLTDSTAAGFSPVRPGGCSGQFYSRVAGVQRRVPKRGGRPVSPPYPIPRPPLERMSRIQVSMPSGGEQEPLALVASGAQRAGSRGTCMMAGGGDLGAPLACPQFGNWKVGGLLAKNGRRGC